MWGDDDDDDMDMDREGHWGKRVRASLLGKHFTDLVVSLAHF